MQCMAWSVYGWTAGSQWINTLFETEDQYLWTLRHHKRVYTTIPKVWVTQPTVWTPAESYRLVQSRMTSLWKTKWTKNIHTSKSLRRTNIYTQWLPSLCRRNYLWCAHDMELYIQSWKQSGRWRYRGTGHHKICPEGRLTDNKPSRLTAGNSTLVAENPW